MPGMKFCESQGLVGKILSISEKLRVKSQGHNMAKYWQSLDYNFIQISPKGEF